MKAEIQPVIAAALADAISFIDDDIGPERARALDYYFGRPFGDEESGRSQVVSRDVHDMVSAALPSLMRIFFGPEHVVEFEPFGPEDEDEAEQKTDYINYIVTVDNDGFDVFYAVLKDALRSKVGFIKSWWDDTEQASTRVYTGLDEATLAILLEDLKGATRAELVETSEDDNGITAKIKIVRRADKARIAAVPPEELIVSRDAVSLDTASLVGHRSVKTASELRAMGIDEEDLSSGADEGLDWNEERRARNPSIAEGGYSPDPSMRRLLYIESYIRTDMDGDGIAELRKVCTVGSNYHVVSDEEVDEHPFADFHCDPEPHTLFGESLADKVMDVQIIKSRLLRAGLDGLAQSVFPRTVVGTSGYIEDAMNTEVGAILRSKGDAASAYSFQAAPDTSRAVLPFVSYMDELRENRTGMSKTSMGLDAEALQNTTATAAEANFTRSQDRIELIARVMSSGMRKLFSRLARLVSENQRSERLIRLRNQWVPMDPRSWASGMNVVCNVGLGGGSPAQKMQALSLIAAKQEAILLQAGPDNPLVTPKQYFETLSRMVQEAGFKTPDAFFTDPKGEEAQARMAEKAQQPPPPDPKVIEVEGRLQLEQQKAQSDAQMAQAKAQADVQLRQMQLQAEGEHRREQLAMDLGLKREQLQAELGLKREQIAAELELKREANMVGAMTSVSTSEVEPGGDPG